MPMPAASSAWRAASRVAAQLQRRALVRRALPVRERHRWPGNVRELEHEIERAVALARADVIGVHDLSPRVTVRPAQSGRPRRETSAATEPLRAARAAFEARYIAEVLGRHQGNVSHAARALRLSRPMLHRKIREYGLR
jgi:DNA-binding NtrC family response regulator